MKCQNCRKGELEIFQENGKKYAKCNKCGSIITADSLRQSIADREAAQLDARRQGQKAMGKAASAVGWALAALFAIFALCCGGLSIAFFLPAAALACPVLRRHAGISAKIWIPLVAVLFVGGAIAAPQRDTDESPAKEAKAENDKEGTQAAKQQDQAAGQAMQNAGQPTQGQAEQENAAQGQAAAEETAQADDQGQQQIAAAEATAQAQEQERAAQEQAQQLAAAQAQAGQGQAAAQAEAAEAQNNFNTYNNPGQQQTESSYVLNTSTKKIHFPGCADVAKIAPENYATFNGTVADAQEQGYELCGHCNPY